MIVITILILLTNSIEAQNVITSGRPIVKTAYGPVQGREMITIDQKKPYFAFQGIPFAEPPINQLRFHEPITPKNWTNVLQTVKDSEMCAQIFANGSEDCLYLNVYTPKIDNSKLPVMVWIFGGFFLQGDSQYSSFGPDYLVNEDVIVVTFNYRLGVFGFLSTEDSASPGNYGLKDQLFALKWVQNNIANFGGDPSNVLLFGESAGSVAVSYLVQTPRSQGLFQRAIMMSGNTLMSWSRPQSPRQTAFGLGAHLGIFTSNSTKLIEELRKKSMRDLQKVAGSKLFLQTFTTNVLDGFTFAPSLEPIHQNAVVTNLSHLLLSNGNFNRIPLMVGFNSNEASLFTDLIDLLRPYMVSYDFLTNRLTPASMNANFFDKIAAGFQIRWRYFEFDRVAMSDEKLLKFANDNLFIRPTTEYVRLVSKYVPTYFYNFSYEGVLGNPKRKYRGVAHAEELQYIFNTEENLKNPPESDLNMRKILVKLWTNFAKFGNPVGDNSGNISWPMTKSSEMEYLDINTNLTVRNHPNKENMKFWANLYDKYGHPPYSTY